jgi:hypothetical protein
MKSINQYSKSKKLSTFQVQWAPSNSFGAEAMAAGPPNLQCFKKIFQKNKKIKILFFFSKFFLEIFQVWRARSHTFGAEAMAQGPPN